MSSSEHDDERQSLLQGRHATPHHHLYTHTDTAVVPISDMDTNVDVIDGGHQRTRRRHASSLSIALEGSGQHNISLAWKDISVTVTVPGKKNILKREYTPPVEKRILTNVSGAAASGCLLAIMGASGSGKSTLLNVLTCRNTKAYATQGEVMLNGVPINSGMRNISAYVQQSDLFIHTLTVREQLQFRALLRMDRKLDKRARLARVEEVITEMGLQGCANSRIGAAHGTKKGISGGERKRLSFASEALTNPPIFFCDEPTSSLDTFMAQSIVHTLQRMAARGRAILCTIHQPSSELFALFNQVLLLSEGRVAFMGTSKECIDFFNRMRYPCPSNFNPSDHYILTLAIVPGREDEARARTKAICDGFMDSPQARYIKEQIETQKREVDLSDHILMNEVTGESRYSSSLMVQVVNLFWRSWTSQYRDDMLFGVRIMQTVVMALVLGLVYLQLDVDQKGVMNINGALFLLLTNVSFTNMFAVLTSFPEEMGIVMREYGSGLYRIDLYYFTKTMAEIPLFTVITVLFSSTCYWMMGFHDTLEAFIVATGVTLAAGIICVNVGYLISVITGDTTLALSVASPALIPFMLFGGVFLNGDSTPDYFIWLEKLSWFKYSYEIMMVNQWDDYDTIPCENSTVKINSSVPSSCRSQNCLYKSGKAILDYNSLDKDNVGEDTGILGAITFGVYMLSLVCLIIRARRSRE
ncbi:unnamed protein product [Lymnaea stagnalis]|uniref:ABC transporter domain-containing protein n=1 Tax=Lymnaea stagnalis TaxID=6523 RepID=A0AAV2HGR8_LYMST